MIAAGLGELAGQDVGAEHREAGAATHRGPGAVSGVADERDPPARPGVQLELADRVEVERGRPVDFRQPAVHLRIHSGECVTQ
jgi:hypothetical protein